MLHVGKFGGKGGICSTSPSWITKSIPKYWWLVKGQCTCSNQYPEMMQKLNILHCRCKKKHSKLNRYADSVYK